MRRIQSMRKVSGVLLLIGLDACRLSLGEASYDQAGAKDEILKLEHTWAQVAVTGDPAVMERIFADDFVGVSPEGMRYTKRDFINDTKANPLGFTSTELDDVDVRFFGNVAVAQGGESFTRKDGGRGRFVWTDVLERRDGEWVLVAAEDVVPPAVAESAGQGLFAAAAPSAQARREIDQTRNAYVSAWRAADPAQIAELYTQDALVMYPNQRPVVGGGAILGYFRGFFGEFPRNEFELTSAEIVVTGPWAFDRGAYRWKGFPRAGGAAVEDSGKYLVILQRQADGRWRVARDMDNSDRAASQSTRGTP